MPEISIYISSILGMLKNGRSVHTSWLCYTQMWIREGHIVNRRGSPGSNLDALRNTFNRNGYDRGGGALNPNLLFIAKAHNLELIKDANGPLEACIRVRNQSPHYKHMVSINKENGQFLTHEIDKSRYTPRTPTQPPPQPPIPKRQRSCTV